MDQPANSMKLTWRMVAMVSATALFLLFCVYSFSFDSSSYSVTISSVWRNVPQGNGDQIPRSLWTEQQSINNNNNRNSASNKHKSNILGTKPVRTMQKQDPTASSATPKKANRHASSPTASNGKSASSSLSDDRTGSSPAAAFNVPATKGSTSGEKKGEPEISKPAKLAAVEPSTQGSRKLGGVLQLSVGGPHAAVSGFTDPYVFPGWWNESMRRSAVWDFRSRFVGDKALFPSCPGTTNATWVSFPFVEPQHYLNNSKNPCWWERPSEMRDLRCVPYFYLAGVAKGGTTDLAKRLRRHPQVFSGTMKEYHWWERIRFNSLDKEDVEETDDTEGGMTFKWYTDKITGYGSDQLEDELEDRGSSVRIFGDFSPSYLWDPKNWNMLEGNQNCHEPRFTVGHHIRHVYPQAKVMFTFRHPTTRLYSRFVSRTARTHSLRHATAQDFHTYVLNGVHAYRRCFEKYSIRSCAYNVSVYHESVVRLIEGMYSVFMADWIRVWPRENILLLRYEDYGGHEALRLAEIFDFLGLDPLNNTYMEDLLSFDVVNSGSAEYHKMGTMLDKTKAVLDEFYEPFIHEFAKLMQDQRFLWQDVSH